MDFALNQEQEMFQQSARQYFESKGLTKLARRFMDGDEAVLDEIWKGISELGYTSINISEEYGGIGQGSLSLVPVLEEIGRALVPGLYPETVGFAVPLTEKYGTEEQKQRYLPEIAGGKRTFSLAMVEPDGSYDASDVHLSAKRAGDVYVLSGVKTLVPHGDVADTLIVPVRTGGGHAEHGISLLLVDTKGANIASKKLRSFDETRKLVELTFSEVRVPADNRLGPEDTAWGVLQDGFLYLNAALCSIMVGGMEQSVDMSVEYGKTRIQFGQPIGRFQAVKHRIVDMKVSMESARSLSYYAAWALEQHDPEAMIAVASARSFITDAYVKVASDNIQNHGGMGFTWEFDCHLYLKRARSWENYLGSAEQYREQTAEEMGW